MSEHGSRRAGGGGGSRGRRSANGGGLSDKLDGLTNQLSGMFGKRGGGRRGGDDDEYDEYGSYDSRGGYDDGYGEEPADVASGGGRRGPGRRTANRSGGGGRRDELPPKDWWMKFINYPRYGKRGWRHWMPSIKQVLSMFLGFLFVVIGAVAYAYASTTIPQVKNSIAAGNPTYYTYDDGTEQFANIGVNYYQVNDINQIPKVFQNAFVAAENYSFWSDPGVSFTGVARSALNDLFGSGQTQGGSTITQQYVKNAYLSQDQTLGRKINEVMISIKLNHTESKQQILLGYLNQISFGRGAYGIDAASRAYFGHPISQMTEANVGEAAFLAAMVNDPSNFSTALANAKARTDNPKTFDRFEKRYNAILANMSQYGFVPKAATSPLENNLPKVIDFKPPNLTGYVGYMKDAATAFLAAQSSEYPNDPATQKYANIDNLSKGGYKIVTTYNHVMMNDAHDAADALWKGESYNGEGKFNPTKHASDNNIHLAFAAVDPHSGELKSFYTGTDGTEDYAKNSFNYALQGGVQVGSTFKPITLATALQTGKFSLDSMEEGSNSKPLYWPPGAKQPMTYTDSHGDSKLYPPNEDDESANGFNGMATLKQGLALSLNSVFVSLELDPAITPQAVYNMAQSLGLKSGTSDLLPVPSLTLGTAEITPMRMANVYGTFANGGVAHEPIQVSEIIDQRTNQVVWTPPALRKDGNVNKQVMSANTAAGVTQALQGVLQKGGTAYANNNAAALVAEANGNLAGKTGTTDFNHSAWFTGFSSSLATSVAIFRSTTDGSLESIKGLGYDDQTTRINGMDWPTTVWSAFMKKELERHKDTFAKPFPAYAPTCSGISNLVSPGQSVEPGTLASGSNLPGTPTGSEANCQSVFVSTPSPTPTPTPTKATTSTQAPLCQAPLQYDPASGQCVNVAPPSTDTTSQQQPTGTGPSNTTSTGPTNTSPSTPSSRCSKNPQAPGCETTSTTSSSSPGFGLPTG